MKKSALTVSVLLLLSVTVILAGACAGTRNTATGVATEQQITNAVDSSHWQFVAYQVSPQFGRSRQVNGSFSVIQNNNKLQVYLPYFGRANGGADVFSTKGPLDFTSTDFTPIVQKPSAGEWRIAIKPKDNREVQAMNFTFFTNGSASLTVTMNNRSGIGFTGRVEPAKR